MPLSLDDVSSLDGLLPVEEQSRDAREELSRGAREELPQERLTFRSAIDALERLRPPGPFLIDPVTGRSESFVNFCSRVRRIARLVAGMGLVRGNKVALLLDSGTFTVELLSGILYGGFVPVPINPGAGTRQITHMLGQSGSRAVFFAPGHRSLLEDALDPLPSSLASMLTPPDGDIDRTFPGIAPAPVPECSADDDALVMYTSGTTGQARGAVFTHHNLFSGLRGTIRTYAFTPADRAVALLPFHHLNAWVTTFLPMLFCGGSIIVPGHPDPSRLHGWVTTFGCTWFATVPTLISRLLMQGENAAEPLRFPSTLRFVRCSSAPLSRFQHEEFEHRTGVLLVEAMGMTEAGEVFQTPPASQLRKVGSPGKPCHETRVVNEHDLPVPAGQTGEIQLRSGRLMRGYCNDPATTADAFTEDGWLRTGDLGHFDDDGYIYITGRIKEIIIRGGINLSAREIDEALLQHPAVLEAAAAGVADEHLGEDVIAHVVVKPGMHCTATELIRHCERLIGSWKTPSRIAFVTSLPKGPSGKIQRLRLAGHREAELPVPHDSASPLTPSPQTRESAPNLTSIHRSLRTLWSEVLRVDQVAPHDNFFASGGNSLSAARALARVREAFNIELPLRLIFEAPTIASIAPHVAAALHRREPRIPADQPQPGRAFGDFPLSSPQSRLQFLHELESRSTAFNIARAERLTGHLDVDALRSALQAVVDRHAALRTTFPQRGPEPVQRVVPSADLRLETRDLRDLGPDDTEEALAAQARDLCRHHFDLAAGPLLRVVLLRISEHEHVLLTCMHHIISDRWSTRLFHRDLAAFYTAVCSRQKALLPPLPIQYTDHAAWHTRSLTPQRVERALQYWLRQLDNAPETTTFAGDPEPPARTTWPGAHARMVLPAPLTAALRALCRSTDTTLFMTLFTVFNVLLFRHTRQTDLVVGTPVAGREHPDAENVIGCFINMLPLRTDLSGAPAFRQLLKQVKSTVLDGFEYQYLPFERLIEAVNPHRSATMQPLVQVVFHYRDEPFAPSALAGIRVNEYRFESGNSPFDMTFSISDSGSTLEIEVEYATALFDPVRIDRMLGHYHNLLLQFTQQPDTLITEASLMTDSERADVLCLGTGPQLKLPATATVHALIETQAMARPDAIAIIHAGRRLTYHEFNQQADALAHRLRQHGIAHGAPVALCMSRSSELPVAMLAILKAGGAWVPLDPAYPASRLAFILGDSDAVCIVTESALLARFTELAMPVICVDRNEPGSSVAPPESPPPDPSAPAYMIYTSGSTGDPKGVFISHANLVGFLTWVHSQWAPGDLAGVAACASICFDFSVFEIFAPLTCGGTCILVNDSLSLDSVVRGSDITMVAAVPAALREMIRLSLIPPTVRAIVSGGEKLDAELVDQIVKSTGISVVHDVYGPTECTVCTTIAQRHAGGPEVIGRPIANARITLRDESGALVPQGVPGEICVSGPGVSAGYHRRPELSAAAFTSDPDAGTPGARLYRTGDLGRFNTKGELQFLGRLDRQIKIRGMRIEPGEVESALRQLPGIHDACVVPSASPAGDLRLVGYLVASAATPSIDQVRQALGTKLPPHLIPAAFRLVDRLPLTSSGKIDRRGLPALQPQGRESTAPDSPVEKISSPRNPVEAFLAESWSEVLGIEQPGVFDDFFALGGHSLHAARVVSRIRSHFQVEFPLRDMFESPTIASSARIIESLLG